MDVTQTSLEAYRMVRPQLGRLQEQVLGILSDGRWRSRDELEAETGLNPNTLRPRVKELMRYGAIQVRGYDRKNNGRRVELLGLR